METSEKKVVLSNGIVVTDNRYLRLGVRIENQRTKYLELSYVPELGFMLKFTGVKMAASEVGAYREEYKQMQGVLDEVKGLIK